MFTTGVTSAISVSGTPLTYTAGVISINVANSTSDGYLTSADWITFNNKASTGSYITSLTGEATSSGLGAATVTLSNIAVIGKVITGYTSGAGTVAATDTILQAIQKLNGNDLLKAPLASPVFTGNVGIGVSPSSKLHVLGDIRTENTTYPKVLFNSSTNGTDLKKFQMYLDTNGTFSIDKLNDAENASSPYIRIKNNGNIGFGGDSYNEKFEVLGGRFALQDGNGATRKALVISGLGYAGLTYSRLQSYDYSTGAAQLVLNDAGGIVSVGTTASSAPRMLIKC